MNPTEGHASLVASVNPDCSAAARLPAFVDVLREIQSRTELALERWLPAATLAPRQLHEAMRYAVLGNGKRIRPALVYLTGASLGVDADALGGPAAAVELIHAYSLVHDDLPAMDDDDLRRGRPTCHRAFDEATAILVGDALQALAFEVLAHDDRMRANAAQRIAMIRELAVASGSRGMAGGQALDLGAVGRRLSLAELEEVHLHKTGALIRASVRLGAIMAVDADADATHRLDQFARCIGLAFQIRDDILDVEGATHVIGKPQGSDIDRNKPTYPDLLGLEGAKRAAADLLGEALAALEVLGAAAEPLRAMADYIVRRER
jgi:farnesyl diphosphate synthase